MKARYAEELRSWAKVTGKFRDATPEEREAFDAEIAEDTGPTGAGWVVELRCYHYYNDPNNRGEIESDHVRKYMTTSFKNSTVDLPTGTKRRKWTRNRRNLHFGGTGVSLPFALG